MVTLMLGVSHVVEVLYLSLIHISEPTRLLSISYAVFCLKKKKSVTAGLYEDPDSLVVSKKQGCDWGAHGRLIKILKNVIGRNHEKI